MWSIRTLRHGRFVRLGTDWSYASVRSLFTPRWTITLRLGAMMTKASLLWWRRPRCYDDEGFAALTTKALLRWWRRPRYVNDEGLASLTVKASIFMMRFSSDIQQDRRVVSILLVQRQNSDVEDQFVIEVKHWGVSSQCKYWAIIHQFRMW